MSATQMRPGIDITICGPEAREAWDTYVQGSPTATLCHQFLWQPIIERAYGHRPYYLIAHNAGRICGVLPLFTVKSRLFGHTLASMPFLDSGGISADDKTTVEILLEHARRLMQEHGADRVELRQVQPLVQESCASLDKVSLVLDLSSGAEAVRQSLPAKMRQVRKAEKSGLSASVGDAEYLDEFYRVFAVNMRDLGSPVHHPSFFTHMFAEFGTQAKVVLVRDGRRAVGGLVCLFFKDTAIVPWVSSLREYFPKCPNHLLYWKAIQYSCARGCRQFDFGRSSVGSGTYNFKRQWGAQPVQLYWYTLAKSGKRHTPVTPDNPKYRMLLTIWQYLPLPFTTCLGPRIRKYLTN